MDYSTNEDIPDQSGQAKTSSKTFPDCSVAFGVHLRRPRGDIGELGINHQAIAEHTLRLNGLRSPSERTSGSGLARMLPSGDDI